MSDIFDLIEQKKKQKKDPRENILNVELERRGISAGKTTGRTYSTDDDDIAPVKTVGVAKLSADELLSSMMPSQRSYIGSTGFVDTKTSWDDEPSGISKLILGTKDDGVAPVKKTTDWEQYLKADDYSVLSKPTGRKSKDLNLWKFWETSEDRGDDKYDFINNLDNYRDTVKLLSGGTSQKDMYGAYTKYSYMSKEQIGIYNYLYATQGKDKAEEYLTDIEEDLNKSFGTDLYENQTAVGKAINWLPAGIENWTENVKQFFSEEERPTSPYAYQAQLIQNEADQISPILGIANKAGVTISNQIPNIILTKGVGTLAQAAGWGAKAVDAAAKVTSAAGIFTSSSGGAYKEALQDGKSEEEAKTYSTIVGALEAGLNHLLGGVEGMTGVGTDAIMRKVATIEKSLLRNIAKHGVRIAGEITEEELQLFAEPLARAIVFGEEYDAPTLGEMAETALITAISTGAMNTVSDIGDGGRVNGLTVDEAKVVDSIVKEYAAEQEKGGKKMSAKEKADYAERVEAQLRRGYVTAEEIEKVLGGDDYAGFKAEEDKLKATDDFKAFAEASADESSLADLKKQYEELYKMPNGQKSDEQRDQQAELKRRIEAVESLSELQKKIAPEVNRVRGVRDEMRSKVQERVKGTYLEESYNELARRNEKANIDVSKYTNETAKKTVQGIVDSKLGDGTNEFADKVDFLANLSAKTGRVYKLMTEQQLKDAGYWEDGKETHGLTDEDGNVLLNYDSSRNLHWTIGHETGHVIEKAGQSKALQEALFNHAIAKEGTEAFNKRLKAKEADYKGKTNTTPEAELANDLLGEYIFSDYEFVSNLAKTNRTVFDKAFDAIKHFYKMATAGSYQQRELEKAKYLFQKALDEAGEEQKNTTENGGVKQAVQSKIVDTNGTVYNKVVKPGLTIYNKLKHNNKNYSAYLEEHIFPRTFSVPALDGATIKVEFAKDNDRIQKDGDESPRKVTGELTAANTTLKKIAILNIRDLIKNSEPLANKSENKHQWLDTNGWSDRKAYMRYADEKNGDKIYPVIIHIANARDGRHILYDVSVFEKEGSTVDMGASVLASQSDDGTSSTRENKSKLAVKSIEPSDEMLAQEEPKVKKKFSFSAINPNEDGSHAVDAEKMEAEGKSSEEIRQETGWFRSYDNQWRYEIDDSKAVWHLDTAKPDQAHLFRFGEKQYKLSDLLDHDELYRAYPQLKDVTVYVNPNTEFGGYVVGRSTDHIAIGNISDDNTTKWTLIHELQHIIQNIEGFATGASKYEYSYLDWGEKEYEALTKRNEIAKKLYAILRRNGESISKEAIEYNQSSYNVSDEIIEENYWKLQNLGWNNKKTEALVDAYYEQVQILNRTTPEGQYHATAGEIEAYDAQARMSMSAEERKAMRPNIDRDDAIVKFSMSKTVEETKDLVALHNLTAEKLLKSLELGGLPMPSIAVTKADIPHDNFGEITLIMGKDTIDPKKNKKNVVYSADAWTPTFPQVEYEADANVEKQINKKLLDLATKVDDVFKHDLDMLRYGHEDNLNRHGGEEGYIQYVMDKYGVKAAYLEDQGKHIDKITEQVLEEKKYNTANEAKYQAVADILGVSSASELGKLNLKETAEQYGEQLEDIYPGITKTAMRMSNLFRQVMAYMDDQGGEPVYRTVTNESAMRQAVDDAIDKEGFEAWTRNLFSGIVKDKGIYNNKDIFTPSGNRKSFKQTHLPFTLENIVKAMASQNGGNTKNVSGFNGIKTLRAGTAERFKSIEAMHKGKGRLQHLTQAEADKINDDLSSRLYAIMEAIDNENGNQGDRNSFIRFDSIGDNLMEISESGKYNVADIQKVFAQYSKNISDDLAADIKQLLFDVSQMPVNIYEAKPERAVTFDEVGVFVIPRNADIKLKQELLNRGYAIAEYDPDVEGDRNKVVNQFEEYKFSLSDAGKDVSTERGAFNERWSDFGRKDILDDFAPVREDTTPMQEDIAPVSEVGDYVGDDEERFNSLTDADMPPVRMNEQGETFDAIALSRSEITDIASNVRDQLGLSSKDMYEVHKLIEQYAQDEFASREDLYDALKEKFGTYVENMGVDEGIKEAKKYLRTYGLYVDESIQKEIADFADLRRRNRGKVRFSRNGTSVDALYHELNSINPGLFPDDILAPTDMFLQMLEVANMDSRMSIEIQHDQSVLKGVADDIADYVDDIRYTQRENSTGVSSESFDDLVKNADRYMPPADDIAPVATAPSVDEIAPVAENVKATEKTAPAKASKAVDSKLDAKIANTQTELDNNRQLREQSAKDYDEEIARLQAKYDALKNKNTLAANDILRSIERKKRLKANNDAGYAKRISDLEARVEKMSSQEYRTAEHRRSKMEEYTEMWKNLIGDTSTWKDLSLGISYKTKTMRRFLRQVVKGADGKANYKLADQIYDELETKYDHNEALLKRESQKQKEVFQNLNLNHAEDTYAHMLGEFRHNPQTTLTEEVVKEYYEKHKNKIDANKVDTAITEARKTFDALLVRVNTVLKEQGMKEIPFRQGYFPHFTNPKQGWLAKILNWKPVNNDIPTDIAGLTEQFDPQRSWQGFNKQRTGDTTDYSLYQGLDTYIHGALDWIYHIEDLQKRRSLENYIRYIHSEEGVKTKIEEIKANENYDADEAQTQIDAVLAEAKNPLGNLVTELRARTNTLANKKSSMDRGVEEATNRKVYSVMTNLNNRINANMVVGSFSSALTNFIPMVQSWHQVSPWFTVRGLGDMVRNAIKDDGMTAKSDFLTNRLIEEEKLYQTGWDKVSDKAAFMMNVIDNITSQTVWRSKYLQNIKEGMNESQAIKDADQFAKNLMAGRSRGNAPSIFDAKNPLTKIFTAFQLEVANQYGYMFEDVPQDSKSPLRLVKGYAMATLGAYAYNALYSSLVGRDAAFDPLSIIEDLLRDLGVGDDDDEEEDVGDALMGLGENIIQEVPYVGSLFGGGRVPMSSAIPYDGDVVSAVEDAIDGEFQFKELLKPLYYLAMPVAGGQLKKTVEGLGMFSDDLPVSGSYTDSGKLRFPVEDTLLNKAQAALFGQYASKNARYYFDNDIAPLGEKQIQEYQDVDIPIKDYWEYRKGLSGLTKAEEKADYINSLDLPISKKNILINNQLDRKEKVDMTDYGDYGSLAEFDFANENPEKYKFLQDSGITYQGYVNADENGKDAYSWAYKNPEKYTMSKAVTSDVVKYRQYTSDLDDIRADKDAKGKTISGSAKNKKIEYINGLDIDYGAKLVLFKSQYKSDDTYNYEIIDYVNSVDDFTYEDRVTILKELGFTVLDDGTVKWD